MCKIMNVFGQNGRENLWMFFQAVIAVYLLVLRPQRPRRRPQRSSSEKLASA